MIQRDILPRLAAIPDVERVENYGLPQAMRTRPKNGRLGRADINAAIRSQQLTSAGTFGR